jgi:hypothetical protein
MPVDIYVHLREGTDILLKQVTATPTTVHLARVSSPYRDLGHRGKASTSTNTEDEGLDIVRLDGNGLSGMVFSPPTAAIGGASPAAVKTGLALGDGTTPNTDGFVASVPDNVSHVPPRQVDLLVSHYYFLTSSGINSYIPCEDVITWSENPRQ